MFPGPRSVAAPLLLVVGVSVKAGDQQAGVAIRTQRGVNFVQVAFPGLDGEPIDQLAHQMGVGLCGPIIGILKYKYDIQVAAISQLPPAQFAVGNDCNLRLLPVPVTQPLPTPAGGDAQHRFRQRTQVISHLLDRQPTFNVARECAEHFGMVRTPQQVKERFIVVLAGYRQGGAALLQLVGKVLRHKTLRQHVIAGQLVDHAWVLQQVAGRPLGITQQSQQTFMHRGALQQQSQVTLATQQGFDPVDQPHGGLFADFALANPGGRA